MCIVPISIAQLKSPALLHRKCLHHGLKHAQVNRPGTPSISRVSKFSVVAAETKIFQRIADILGFVFGSGHSTESCYIEF